MTRILVTPRSLSNGNHPSLLPLMEAGFAVVTPAPGDTPTEEQLKDNLPGCVGWLAGVEPVSKAVIDAADALRVISRNGSGVDNLPTDYLCEKGIEVARAGGSNARGVAELTLGLMLAVLRNIPQSDRGIRNASWPRLRGRELSSLTVGVVGLGAIGQTTAELCYAVGSKVVAYDPFVSEVPSSLPNLKLLPLPELFRQVDIVTFHCPAPEDNYPLLGMAEVEKAKPGLIVVNTARSSLIDDEAVLDGLNSGQLFGLATDVFDREPPELNDLLSHDRTVLTSHIGGFTDESVARSSEWAVTNLLAALEK